MFDIVIGDFFLIDLVVLDDFFLLLCWFIWFLFLLFFVFLDDIFIFDVIFLDKFFFGVDSLDEDFKFDEDIWYFFFLFVIIVLDEFVKVFVVFDNDVRIVVGGMNDIVDNVVMFVVFFKFELFWFDVFKIENIKINIIIL